MSYFKTVEPRYDFKFWAIHHYFTGYAISLVGFWALFHNAEWLAHGLIALGLWITVDDWIQHTIQRRKIKRLGFYTKVSFWHWWPYAVLNWISNKLR